MKNVHSRRYSLVCTITPAVTECSDPNSSSSVFTSLCFYFLLLLSLYWTILSKYCIAVPQVFSFSTLPLEAIERQGLVSIVDIWMKLTLQRIGRISWRDGFISSLFVVKVAWNFDAAVDFGCMATTPYPVLRFGLFLPLQMNHHMLYLLFESFIGFKVGGRHNSSIYCTIYDFTLYKLIFSAPFCSALSPT